MKAFLFAVSGVVIGSIGFASAAAIAGENPWLVLAKMYSILAVVVGIGLVIAALCIAVCEMND